MGFQNFLNFPRIFGEKRQKKSLVLRILRYSIWEVQYDILFNTLKVSIYRHSIISRYDKLSPDLAGDEHSHLAPCSHSLPTLHICVQPGTTDVNQTKDNLREVVK